MVRSNMSSALLLIVFHAGLRTGELPEAPSQGETAAETRARAQALSASIRTHASHEFRDRVVSGGLAIAGGGARVGIGAYGLAAFDDEVVRRSAIMAVVGGSRSLVSGTFQVSRRGPLERLSRGPEVARLEGGETVSSANILAVERAWAEAARRARKGRIVRSSLQTAGGVVSSTFGVVALAQGGAAGAGDGGKTVVGATLLASGIASFATAIRGWLVPSATEQGWTLYRAQRSSSVRGEITAGPRISLHRMRRGLAIKGVF